MVRVSSFTTVTVQKVFLKFAFPAVPPPSVPPSSPPSSHARVSSEVWYPAQQRLVRGWRGAGLGATAAHLGAGKAPAGWGLDSFPAPLSKQLLPWSLAFLCPYLPVQGKAINVIGHEVIHPLLSYAYAKQALLLEWEPPYQEWVVKDFSF